MAEVSIKDLSILAALSEMSPETLKEHRKDLVKKLSKGGREVAKSVVEQRKHEKPASNSG